MANKDDESLFVIVERRELDFGAIFVEHLEVSGLSKHIGRKNVVAVHDTLSVSQELKRIYGHRMFAQNGMCKMHVIADPSRANQPSSKLRCKKAGESSLQADNGKSDSYWIQLGMGVAMRAVQGVSSVPFADPPWYLNILC